MKSKMFYAALILVFSISSFAGSIVKIDSGSITWTVNADENQNGVLTYVKSGVRFEGPNLMSDYELKASFFISLVSPIKSSMYVPMKFTFTDERSQESVELKVQEILKNETLASVNGVFSVEIFEQYIQIKNLNCAESGVTKKRLTCSAEFVNSQVIDLK
jgi:hypothetical protein